MDGDLSQYGNALFVLGLSQCAAIFWAIGARASPGGMDGGSMIGTIAGIIAMLLAAGLFYAACVVAARADRERGE